MHYVTGVLYVSTPSLFSYNCYVTSTWCRPKLAIFTKKISPPPSLNTQTQTNSVPGLFSRIHRDSIEQIGFFLGWTHSMYNISKLGRSGIKFFKTVYVRRPEITVRR